MHRRVPRPALLALLLVTVLLPFAAAPVAAAGPRARTPTVRVAPSAIQVPAGFSMPSEWRAICDSIGKRGTPLVRGTNCRYLKLDGVFRRWIVDIPRNTALPMDREWPVVMVIHGSNSSSESIRERTTWPAVAAREGAIAIYPTAWRYRRSLNGRAVTRWATYTIEKEVDLDQRLDGYPKSSPYPARDMVFLRKVMRDLRGQVNLDRRHIHAIGSSQGGRFISRMAVEWSDTFASMSCFGWCDAPPRSVEPARRMSILYGLGTVDHLVLNYLRTKRPGLQAIPLAWSQARSVLKPLLRGHERAWDLPDDPQKVTPTSSGLNVQWRAVNRDPRWVSRFKLMLIAGGDHPFPTGTNNPPGVDFAEVAWAFFLDNPMPPS